MFNIAVNLPDAETWTPSVEYAAGLAALLGASFTGIHTRSAPLYESPSTGQNTDPPLANGTLASRRAFCERAKAKGISQATWQVVEGFMPDILAHACNWLDLVVLERHPTAAWGSPTKLGHLVVASGGACLITPGEWTPSVRLERVLIGWNGSPEAIRATRAALPLLRCARTVVVLAGATRSPFMDNWEPPFSLSGYLAHHHIDHEVIPYGGADEQAGQALLDQAAALEADLLVMGAYGRSRFSEWIFGGATREVLRHAQLPVLLKC